MVAVQELEEVPEKVALVVGDIEHEDEVKPVMWSREPIFKKKDMPIPPGVFTASHSKETMAMQDGESSQGRVQGDELEIDDQIHISKRALMEIYKDEDVESLLEELRQILNGAPPGSI